MRSAANIYMFVQRIFANTQTKLATLCDQQHGHGVYEVEKLEEISSLTNFVLIFLSQINCFLPRGQLLPRFLDDNPEIQTLVDTHLTFIAVTVLTV